MRKFNRSGMKTIASRKVRRYKGEIQNGNSYKKIFNSWDISDFCWYQTKEEAIMEWYKDQYDIINNVNSWKSKYQCTLEEELAMWKKDYYCK
ncbi:hypothetical protein [uncultured Clostridium sp.]|uniref:hypothetical protein n=1 Tax=uncultured Clostridium sp. TaxID=59620 RepID=UPI0026EBEF21|nr:hypothetical protein [uncultured Clostridium sp.]